MRFLIERASHFSLKDKPCKNAYLLKHNKSVSDWAIDVGSLEELMGLIDETSCEIVLGKQRITIYDGYLE